MAHHYKESGLDNVYLENGYKAIETPYGTGMAVQNADGLHKAIGLWLVAQPIPLNGAELRFLRIEMELTQRDLAGISARKNRRCVFGKEAAGSQSQVPPIDCFGPFIRSSSRATVPSGAWSIGWRISTRGPAPARGCEKRRTAGKWKRPRRATARRNGMPNATALSSRSPRYASAMTTESS